MIPWRVKNFFERQYYERFHATYVNIAQPNGLASFTFDDFPATAYERAGPLLLEKGWRGTYYTAAGLAGTDGEMGPMFTLDLLERCFEDGHEIADHTFSHAYCVNLDRNGLRRERAENGEALSSYEVENFSFPFGSHDHRSAAALAPHFRSMRTVTPGLNSGRTDLKKLKANALYEHRPVDDILRLVDKAQEAGGWIIFYTHDLSPTPSPFGCTAAYFEQVLAAVERAGLHVGTMRQCLDIILGAGSRTPA